MTSDSGSSAARSRRSFDDGDLAIAGALLVLTLPLFLAVSLLIKLESPGPVFETCEQIGRGGRPFLKLRFRTTDSGLGQFLRQTRIELLPELINVLRGQLSIDDTSLFD